MGYDLCSPSLEIAELRGILADEIIFNWESVKKKVGKGDWKEVEELVDRDNSLLTMHINTSNDTILHLAAQGGQKHFILTTLQKIVDVKGLLYATNEAHNSPLHSAASAGQKEICEYLLKRVPELANYRNISGETPVFLAALNNHKETFLFLREKSTLESLRRSKDGENVLHSAILGEEFELALEIIMGSMASGSFHYLLYARNDRGYTPLHLLANNSSSFKSGYEMGIFHQLIYSCIRTSTPVIDESSGQRPTLIVGESRRQRPTPIVGESSGQRPETRVSRESNINESHQEIGKVRKWLTKVRKWLTLVYLLPCILCMKLLNPLLQGINLLLQAIIPIEDMKKKKQLHIFAELVMKEMVRNVIDWNDFSDCGGGMNPKESSLIRIRIDIRLDKCPDEIEEHLIPTTDKQLGNGSSSMKEVNRGVIVISPLLIAVKKGVTEFVDAILERFPMAIHDMDSEHKSILLLTAEYRQHEIYDSVKDMLTSLEVVDRQGNTILHLAAKQGKQRLVDPNAAVLMAKEIKWFKHVKDSIPQRFAKRQNHNGETAEEIFTETHQKLAKLRANWLRSTSKSGSFVAALIITIAFATVSTVPGGLKNSSGPPTAPGSLKNSFGPPTAPGSLEKPDGTPIFQDKPGFHAFAVSSIAALCFSSTSAIIFLSILTSTYQELDLENVMPKKLIYGISCLFLSIVAMYSSFFSGYSFVLDHKMQYVVFPIFIITSCLALANFRFYYEFIKSTMEWMPIPKRKRH